MGMTIEELQAEIAGCRICRDAPLDPKKPLPHEPRPVVVMSETARILIAGQAPGLRVHESGIPFNDASGDRLRDWLDVDRETFYDARFCFPGYDEKGSDLPPRRECAPVWLDRVMGSMPQVELVLTIGQYAQAWHMGGLRKDNMTETVKAWRETLFANRSPAILPLPHPSWRNSGWLKRNPWFGEELLPVLRSRIKLLAY
jgi:uracil-DNA glycosylase